VAAFHHDLCDVDVAGIHTHCHGLVIQSPWSTYFPVG
jgi:hypothetical protein